MDYVRSFFSTGANAEQSPLLPNPYQYPDQYHPRSRLYPRSPQSAVKFAPFPEAPAPPRLHTAGAKINRRKSRRTMSTERFRGPISKNLIQFMEGIKNVPAVHKTALDSASKCTIETICDPKALHVWESDSDLDSLLQLAQVIVKLKNLGASSASSFEREAKVTGAAMVIITQENRSCLNFKRILELVRHITGEKGTKQVDGTIYSFNAIAIVRGVRTAAADKPATDSDATVKRINIAIERISASKRPVVWHHGPVLALLLTWINTTTGTLRSRLSGITVTCAIDFAAGIRPSARGRANSQQDVRRLEDYAKKLSIPVLFLDPTSQLVIFDYPSTYMYFWPYYIHTFLPASLVRAHHYKALDRLVAFCFRLRAASEGKYGNEVVDRLQRCLKQDIARSWANKCVDKRTYGMKECRSAAAEAEVHTAALTADSPFALLDVDVLGSGCCLSAFGRLPVCPSPDIGSSSTAQHYIAAPITLNLSDGSFRAECPSQLHVLIPQPDQDVEKVTARIQGTMLGVLERLRQHLANSGSVSRQSHLDEAHERKVWAGVVAACTWALEGCKGKLPSGVEEKVAYVTEKLKAGTWAWTLGMANSSVIGNGMGNTSAFDINRANGGYVQPQPQWGMRG